MAVTATERQKPFETETETETETKTVTKTDRQTETIRDRDRNRDKDRDGNYQRERETETVIEIETNVFTFMKMSKRVLSLCSQFPGFALSFFLVKLLKRHRSLKRVKRENLETQSRCTLGRHTWILAFSFKDAKQALAIILVIKVVVTSDSREKRCLEKVFRFLHQAQTFLIYLRSSK